MEIDRTKIKGFQDLKSWADKQPWRNGFTKGENKHYTSSCKEKGCECVRKEESR
jgi:hypothetical protein